MKRLFAVVVVACLLASYIGCATVSVPTSQALAIPYNQWIAPEFAIKHASGDVEVIVKRDSGVFGSGYTIVFHVEGKPIVKLEAGEIARLYLPPGKHLLGVFPEPNILWAGTLYEIEADVRTDLAQVYRIFITSSGAIQISRTSQ